MLRDPPAMAERVHDLTVALAPERILQWPVDLGARREGSRPQPVGVVGGDDERDGRHVAFHGEGRQHAELGELVGEHELGVPEAEGDRHQLAVGQGEARDLLEAERGGVPVGRAGGPVVRDARLVAGFLALHRTLEAPASTLERDTALTEWLHDLAAHSPSSPRAVARRRAARDEPALRRALDHLGDSLTANPSLDELAAAAGTGRYRLTRLFRDGLGLPPHRYQIAQRVRLARRLLERGEPVASVAAATGFVDQSHFHRHFRRSLGVTPRQYVARF